MKEIEVMTDQEIKEMQEQIKKELSVREEKRKNEELTQRNVRKLQDMSARCNTMWKNIKLIGKCFEETHKDNSKSIYYVTGIDGLYIFADVITKSVDGTKFVKEHKKLSLIPDWKPSNWGTYKQYLLEECKVENEIERNINDSLFGSQTFRKLFNDRYSIFDDFLF